MYMQAHTHAHTHTHTPLFFLRGSSWVSRGTLNFFLTILELLPNTRNKNIKLNMYQHNQHMYSLFKWSTISIALEWHMVEAFTRD